MDDTFIYSLLEALGYALRTSYLLRRSYAAVFIQDAQRPVTAEEEALHNDAFDEFLKSTVFILIQDTTLPDYARWLVPATITSPHRIKLPAFFLHALVEKQHRYLIFLFFMCMVHELAHGYTYHVRTRARRSPTRSFYTLRNCAVGDRHGMTDIREKNPPVPKGESGYVVENQWIQGTLKCIVKKPWNGEWGTQWDQFEGFQVMDEKANMGKGEKEQFARALGM